MAASERLAPGVSVKDVLILGAWSLFVLGAMLVGAWAIVVAVV